MKIINQFFCVAFMAITFTATANSAQNWWKAPGDPVEPTQEFLNEPFQPQKQSSSKTSQTNQQPFTSSTSGIIQGMFELSGQSAITFSDLNADIGGVDVDLTTFNLQFDGVYYFSKNIGFGLIFALNETEIESEGVSVDLSAILFGPQVTVNVPVNEKMSLYANGALAYATAEVQNEDADGFSFQVGGGVKYFLRSSVSINGILKYQYLNLEDDFGNDLDIDGISLGVGLSVYF